VLFFAAPPLDVTTPVGKEGRGGPLGHTVRYLAAKYKREELLKAKRRSEEAALAESEVSSKKAKIQEDAEVKEKAEALTKRAVGLWNEQMLTGLISQWKELYGDKWEDGVEFELGKLEKAQAAFDKQMSAQKKMLSGAWRTPTE
jgi:chromatin structure-remodeling complex subunit RSC1/2